MTKSSSASLDSLLARWHEWQQQYQPVKGYASRSLVVGEYRSGRDRDSDDGTLDNHLDDSAMRSVEFHVGEIADPWRAALYQEAKNLAVGAAVFTSPRLPADRLERHEIIQEARQRLSLRLLSAGVLL